MSEPSFIVKAEVLDAEELSVLILSNASYFLKPYYSKEQWAIFKSYYAIEAIQQKIIHQKVFCAKQNGSIVGTIALDHNYIVGFYTHLAAVQKGIGSSLLQHIERESKTLGFSELFLASSPVGVNFYLKYGWQIVEEISIDYLGVSFIETKMKKQL